MRRLWITFILAGLFGATLTHAANRDKDWGAVQEAINKGLPKTAIEKLEPIIKATLAEKAHPEAIKAIAQKIALEGNIEGNKPEEKIFRLEAEIAKSPAEMRPVMEAILAHWYWQYFQQNRWRFMQRTQTAESPGADIQTWDLARIVAEIDKHFMAALGDGNAPKPAPGNPPLPLPGGEQLKKIPIADYNALLEKGAMPDSYRPTLYDFLVHEALSFYQAGEQGAVQAEDTFVLDASTPIFGTVAEFMKWQPESTDSRSPKLKSIRLLQDLLTFHVEDKSRDAFADADLERLNLGSNQATGEEKRERYKLALERFEKDWANHEISARAIAHRAGVLQEEDKPIEAHQLAERGLKAFPDSVGAAMCFNLIRQLEAKSARINTDRVWNDPLPTIDVTYRNVTQVYFRAMPYDFEGYLKSQRWGMYQFDDDKRKELLRRKPALEWNVKLPPTDDYRERVQQLPAPKDLRPGFYFIVASHKPDFDAQDNQVSVAPVWVSDLALVVRQRHYEGRLEGFLLQARTGEPIAGGKVRLYERDREGWFQPGDSAESDANGLFQFKERDRQYGILLATANGQQLASANEYWVNHTTPETANSQTVFFTDRSLYRPGQTIYYKGICLQFDQAKSDYAVLPKQSVTVAFNDPNGKEIARATHQCNEYGSFDGAFTAPRDRVTGQMQIVAHGPHGATAISVEEYKRPKFQVELTPPKEATKLGEEVVMPGKATAYTGAPIGGATIKWRVQREVRFPIWCWWARWFWPNAGQGQAIAHGQAVTEADGSFTVKFVAKPDPEISAKEEPIFEYHVYADVTDTTGETRSDERVTRAGFTALQATLAAEQWQTPKKPVEFNVTTKTLDDDPQAAKGTLKVYALKQPDKVQRAALQPDYYMWFWRRGRLQAAELPTDPANPDSWALGKQVMEKSFATDATGNVTVAMPLKAGIYRAVLETKDRFGKAVTARMTLQVVDPRAARYGVKIANHFVGEKWSLEPGESLVALWGTGYENGRAFVELEHRGKSLRSWWTAAERTQEVIEQNVTEEMRGGFTLRVTYVRENRAYLNEAIVDVPWSNKELTVKWEHFTSKLMPGQKETWTAVVGRPRQEKASRELRPPESAVAEMVAALYDASLDQYLPHDWQRGFGVFRREVSHVNSIFENSSVGFQHLHGYWPVDSRGVGLSYRHFPNDLVVNLWGYGYFGDARGGRMLMKAGAVTGMAVAEMRAMPASAPAAMEADGLADKAVGATMREENKRSLGLDLAQGGGAGKPPGPDLSKVTARKNLNETAFFLPHLMSDEKGVVRIEFAMPEALTEWKFLGFAHDRELRAGYLTDKTVTAKDLMVEPNPPRFVREGDTIEFAVKVTNQTAEKMAGKARLTFANARTQASVDAALNNAKPEIEFEVPGKQSRSYSWRITVPDGCEFLTYKVVGATDKLSDGEEGFLPVLSRRILVAESLPLPIRGKQTKEFQFSKLLESGKSDTLEHQALTVQMVSQPAWYAVMALPYLMEYPYECSEQIFNRLYANTLARFIANSDPKIRRIFDLWKNTPALDSPLEKNQDLKSVMLEETPWYRQAIDESQARRNVGILFDANRLDAESARALRKLADQQLNEGLWPWFPGGQPSEYISLYIMTGFGRLRHLGVDVDVASAVKSLTALDRWVDAQYREILKHGHKELNHLHYTIAFYLYGRSFFLKDQPIAKEHREAVDYWLGQGREYWLQLDCRQSQAHLAIGLKRFGDEATPVAIMKSIKERSVSNEELGMFWRDTELSWWWYRAPIETQAMMIEAFAEVMNDAEAVEDCKVWLLKQKQTQDWKTTKATADAVYGLLLRGTKMLASDALVEVALGGEWIKPEKIEAGTGFYEQRFTRKEIKPEQGRITVKKVDDGVSWGSVHWQYLEDMTKVTPWEGTPLKLKKTLWRKETTKRGQELQPVKGPVQVGDELVVRIELRSDRDMEYVHLKDQRGSGTEPVSVLSQYKFQDGLAYYESTRDTASHFFIDYLPKGVYVFEYSTRIQLKGNYQTGIANIECMYAPEFNSHSESFELVVK